MTELWACSAPRQGVRGVGRGLRFRVGRGRLEGLWQVGSQGGRRQGGGGATHWSILALKSNTPSINLAANLEGPVRDQKAVWTPRRRSLGQRSQGDGRSLVQGSDLLPSSSLLLTESLKEFKCRTCVPVPAHVVSRERD